MDFSDVKQAPKVLSHYGVQGIMGLGRALSCILALDFEREDWCPECVDLVIWGMDHLTPPPPGMGLQSDYSTK